MLRFLYTAAAVFAVAGVATAAPVSFFNEPLNSGWNIGSGQPNSNFVGVRDAAFAGGSIELGLRAQQRFAGPYTPVMTPSIWGTLPMYTTTTGLSGAPDLAVWNFDGSVVFSGGTGNLDDVSLTISPVSGGVQELNDLSTTGAGYTFFFPVGQFSQNPGFGQWSGPGNYDFNATGLYLFTLTATENGQTVSTQMLVNVGGVAVPTPEPVSLLVFGGLAVGGAAAAWRRKKAMA